MKNYLIDVKVNEVGDYDMITMAKILSTVVARCGNLYCIDYHGFEHGIFIGEEDQVYYIKVIINNLDDDFDIDDMIDELKERFSDYKIYNIESDIKIVDKETDIPNNYTEQYYFNYYNI